MSLVIDHISIVVRDIERSADFYRTVLAALGMKQLIDAPSPVDGAITFGFDGEDDFAIIAAGEVEPTSTAHIAFTARSIKQVQEFHAAAIGAGARERIAPSVRAEYSPVYYATFVDDPDGNNVEAVYHAEDPEELDDNL